MLKLLRYAPNVWLLLRMWLAARVARKDRQRGARLFLRLAASVESRWRVAPPLTRRNHVSDMMIHALLLRQAPYEQIRPWTDGLARPARGMQSAFESYFADGNLDQTLLAATDWCRAVEAEVEQDRAEMSKFFARYGDDFSEQKMTEIFADMDQAESGATPAETLAKVGTITPAHRRVFAYYHVYDAHLALEAARWMQGRKPSTRRAETLKRESQRGEFLGLPQFRVRASSLGALGMNPTKLAAARRRAMGG